MRETVLVGGCKSLSGSMLGWVFGDRLESWLTGAQIDEVMVMDGGNKGLDVLSVASDEAGMNHPSGAAEHDAAQSLGLPPRHHTPPPSLHSSSLCLETHQHYEEAAASKERGADAQQPAITVSICADAYFEGCYDACLSISKHSTRAVQSTARCSLIVCPNITC